MIVVVLGIDPVRHPVGCPDLGSKLVNERQDGDAEKDGYDSLAGESPRVSRSIDPGCDKERVDKGTHVEEHRVEGDYSHGLQRVAVDGVCGDGCVAHLDSGSDY